MDRHEQYVRVGRRVVGEGMAGEDLTSFDFMADNDLSLSLP